MSWIAFGCVHAPLHDPEAIDWLIGQIKEEKPDYIIHLGDGFEADSASRWPSEYNFTLADEFIEHDKILLRIRKASPKSKKVFIEGNHDNNLIALNRIDKKLRGLCDYRIHQLNKELVAHWEMPTIYNNCRRRGVWRLGEVAFAHGYACGVKGGENEACRMANEYGLYVRAHTHRPTNGVVRAMKTGKIPLRYWYANAGTLRGLDPDYMKRNSKELWGQACVVGQCQPIKSPRREKTWEAEVRIFRMFDEV